APVHTLADLLTFGHLGSRRFWAPGDVPGSAGPVLRPGGPFLVDGERIGQPGAVPGVDEHGAELRSSAGGRRARHRAGRGRAEPGGLPLAGVRVADFSWIGVGPITTKALADHGATVVRIESETRLDTLRAQAPFMGAEFGLNRSNFFGTFNTSK